MPLADLPFGPSRVLPGRDLSWTAVRSGGPGGQNVNKVASKVELRFDLRGTSAFDDDEKARLGIRLASRLTTDGTLVVRSEKTRDQGRNLVDACERLVELLKAALVQQKKRRATRPTKGSVRRRVDAKRHDARTKASRRVGND